MSGSVHGVPKNHSHPPPPSWAPDMLPEVLLTCHVTLDAASDYEAAGAVLGGGPHSVGCQGAGKLGADEKDALSGAQTAGAEAAKYRPGSVQYERMFPQLYALAPAASESRHFAMAASIRALPTSLWPSQVPG
jgi:hypothetical protein